MGKVSNNFIGGKMNKDLDGRLLPRNQYRDALNAQVSKSEGENVGELENILGNHLMPQGDFSSITGVANLKSIGFLADETSNYVFIFLTNNSTETYTLGKSNFIFAYNTLTEISTQLVSGNFLNFSTQYPITGVNVLENLLFWTDNRNQPRKINIETALNNPNYYTTEDHISVAKYNPFINIELWKSSADTDGLYETTMYNVSNKYYPDGGSANITGTLDPENSVIQLTTNTIKGDIPANSTIAYITPVTGLIVDTGQTVTSYDSATGLLTASGNIGPFLSQNIELVFSFNPYYEGNFNGDPDFLEDKFVRFSYRFRFDDGEYSIMSPFTQNTFIPKQDGYFLYKDQTAPFLDVKNEEDAYRSTIVDFMENKVDKVILKIPFEYQTHLLQDNLKINHIEILYKESDQIATSVLETIPIQDVANQSAQALVNGAVTSSTTVLVDNIQYGNINKGVIVTGVGVENNPTVVSFNTATNEVTLSSAQTLSDDTVLIFGDLQVFEYEYQSKKPYKVLPEAANIRVYDKVPVKALAQEIISNRVVYGNYQDKHTPPETLNYNVAVSNKCEFELNEDEGTYDGGGGTINPGEPIDIDMGTGSALFPGKVISSDTPGVTIPPNTLVSSTNNNGDGVFITGLIASSGSSDDFLVKETNGFIPVGAVVSGNGVIPGTTVLSVVVGGGSLGDNEQYVTCSSIVTLVENQPIYFGSTSQTETIISLNKEVVFPAGVVDLNFKTVSNITNCTSTIEYPNHTLKQNRNYQVGVVLSDRYGRQSTVILSNNKQARLFGSSYFTGSSVYAPYLKESTDTRQWPGNALKVLFNETINPVAAQTTTGWPGVYNGDAGSTEYNPLGWYSFKIVVKQQEQEYYNVYLPGVMASYPTNTTLEVGKTSHTVLINDNINKIPRDLSEVGPEQRQFRSSVKLFGRVENNTNTDAGSWNNQYYPNRSFDFASSISTNNNLFNGEDELSYTSSAEFYNVDSDPLIARLSTNNQFGTTATIIQATTLDVVNSSTIGFDTAIPLIGAPFIGCSVTGFKVPKDLIVSSVTGVAPNITAVEVSKDGTLQEMTLAAGTVLTFNPPNASTSVQKLAVYETEPVQSLLEIFWETSTSGTIEDLNNAIINDESSTDSVFGFNTINFCESNPPGTNISTDFNLIDNFGATIPYVPNQDPPQLQLISVTDFNDPPQDRSNDFILIDNQNGTYNIQTTTTFYYGFDAEASGTFSFELLSTVNDVEATIILEPVTVCNDEPIISNCPPTPINWDPSDSLDLVVLTGVNGSASSTEAGEDLTWGLAVEKDGVQYGPEPNGNGSFTFTVAPGSNSSLCTVSLVEGAEIPNGTYNVTVTLTDAGGDSVECVFSTIIVNTSCCDWAWQAPRISITGPQGQLVTIKRPFRFVNCEGVTVNVGENSGGLPLEGQFIQVCAQSSPQLNSGGVWTDVGTQYCVGGVPIIDPSTGEPYETEDGIRTSNYCN